MSTEPIVKPESAFTEAPASWNTRYVTPEGFVCQITLRGESGKDLLDKAGIALSFLLERGFQPDQKPSHNGNGETRQCPIHKVEMRRFEKDGRTWYSHKTEEGWCRGKPKGDHHA